MSLTVITKIGPRVLPQARMQPVPWLPKGVITQPRPWKQQLRGAFARSRGAQVFALREQKVPWKQIAETLGYSNATSASTTFYQYKAKMLRSRK